MDGTGLLDELRAHAREAGIDLLGVTSAEPFELREPWRHDQPRELLPGARAVVVAGFCAIYEPRLVPAEPGRPRGRFTAFGSRVYEQMTRHCMDVVEGCLRERGYAAVDAMDVAIKPAVVRSGLGRYGKHGVVITPELGSMVMFAAVVTDAPLADARGDAPLYEETCPSDCRLCLDACPTRALAGDYRPDRPKCITNWLWGATSPRELRHHQRDRLFGCAECLLACPRNEGVERRGSHLVPTDTVNDSPELIPLIAGDRDYYDRSIPTFPKQAGFGTMRLSAAVAAGNVGDPGATETLADALRAEDARLRAYSAWALGRIGTPQARGAVGEGLARESDAFALEEMTAALAE